MNNHTEKSILTEIVRLKYMELVNAFRSAGVEPDITIWVHHSSNDNTTREAATNFVKQVSDSEAPKIVEYPEHRHLLPYGTASGTLAPNGAIHISFPLE